MQKKEKRYYWLKLTENFFFENDGPFDFLMNYPSGAKYVVLYQMLCLKTINTCGVFVTKYGDMVIKLTIAKIKKDCKHFSEDEITVALELFKKVGLVIEDEKGFLEIKDHESLIGSETDAAQRMRKSRLKAASLTALPRCNNVTKKCNKECNNVTVKILRDIDKLDIHSSNTVSLDNTVSSCIISESVTKDVTSSVTSNNDNNDPNFRLEAFKPGARWEGVMISSEQFDDLCERLSYDELHHYLDKMKYMVDKGYIFNCSHYEFVLKMVEQDRRVKK